MRIWKYSLHLISKQFIDVPLGAERVHFGIQGNQICLWLKVDVSQQKSQTEIICVGTGEEISGGLEHIGTVVLPNLEVYHYFWRSL